MKKVALTFLIVMAMMMLQPIGFARILGDADGNGTVNIVDSLQIARFDAKLIGAGDFEHDLSDVDGDGVVTVVDSLQIARFDAKLITEFPGQIPPVIPPTQDNDDDNIPNDEHYTLTITSDPVSGGTVTGAGEYPIVLPSELAQMRATPTLGWKFEGWSGDAEGRSPSGFVVMDGNKNVVANFSEAGEDDPSSYFELTTRASPFGYGSVDVLQDPAEGGYVSGARVRITAIEAEGGYIFDYWTGEVENADAVSTIVVMDEDKTVTAVFKDETPPVISGATQSPALPSTIITPPDIAAPRWAPTSPSIFN